MSMDASPRLGGDRDAVLPHRDARGVDEDGRCAERVGGAGEGRGDVGGVGDVGPQPDGADGEVGGKRRRALLDEREDVQQRDFHTAACEGAGHVQAEPARSTGDDGDLAFEVVEHAHPPSLTLRTFSHQSSLRRDHRLAGLLAMRKPCGICAAAACRVRRPDQAGGDLEARIAEQSDELASGCRRWKSTRDVRGQGLFEAQGVVADLEGHQRVAAGAAPR
jgi:hypothetical protein